MHSEMYSLPVQEEGPLHCGLIHRKPLVGDVFEPSVQVLVSEAG